jgi:hypothetical protein
VRALHRVSAKRLDERNVAYLPSVRTVESQKQPLLANGSETTLFLGNGRETDN